MSAGQEKKSFRYDVLIVGVGTLAGRRNDIGHLFQ
jgi:hypothetical protein